MEIDETEERVDLREMRVGGMRVFDVGVSESGIVYLPGDLHPKGSFACLMIAAKEHVPYVYTSAVSALFPADWVRAACTHDPDRLRIIDNIERQVRSGG